jgi:dipeptidyl aminopeptidase/acylaminoacyl peptidase
VPLGINGRKIRSGFYHVAWQPGGNRIAFFNNVGFFLTDASSHTMCEIDLGTQGTFKRWALSAKWSSDGRYLALLTTMGEPIVPFIDLTLIDMNTGQLRRLDLGHQDLHAIAWAPNYHDLLVIAAPPRRDPTQANVHKVYLVDATTAKSRQILTEYQSEFVFHSIYGAEWSPDAQTIALSCPIIKEGKGIIEGRLCLVSVEVK